MTSMGENKNMNTKYIDKIKKSIRKKHELLNYTLATYKDNNRKFVN
jgi:hypothetical protein